MIRFASRSMVVAWALAVALPLQAAESSGHVKLTSAGPLAFGPKGVLLIADPLAATVYAVETGDAQGNADQVKLQVSDLQGKIASMLGVESRDVRVADLAVNPANANVYLSVTRGQGPDSQVVILRVDADGKLSEFALDSVKYSMTKLPNAPQSQATRRGNPRNESITDMAYVSGRVFIAGLSNEEFASKLRSVAYPFTAADEGTSVEIYHGAHGKFETRSPVRTFAPFKIGDQDHLIAAYTCTPLVKFPVSALKPGEKIKGTTIAELGNRNRPLDMVVYQKNGKNYILMANSARGMMKISTEGITIKEGIESPVGGGGTAGLSYDTIEDLAGVQQLDQLNSTSAVVLVQTAEGTLDLKTVPLP